VREQARLEREAQQRRKEEIMKEMEERKAKIRKDKRIINDGKIITIEMHEKEIKDLVKGLKKESKDRVQ
jgi:hypothetical protein